MLSEQIRNLLDVDGGAIRFVLGILNEAAVQSLKALDADGPVTDGVNVSRIPIR